MLTRSDIVMGPVEDRTDSKGDHFVGAAGLVFGAGPIMMNFYPGTGRSLFSMLNPNTGDPYEPIEIEAKSADDAVNKYVDFLNSDAITSLLLETFRVQAERRGVTADAVRKHSAENGIATW